VKVILISGRSIGQGRGKELGKFSEQYFQSVAICELSSEDMGKAGDMRNVSTIEIKVQKP
jgi:formylmethanofuran dehydrogenase subunit D